MLLDTFNSKGQPSPGSDSAIPCFRRFQDESSNLSDFACTEHDRLKRRGSSYPGSSEFWIESFLLTKLVARLGCMIAQVCVFAFDLLYLDGQVLTSLPLHERRARLRSMLAAADPSRVRLASAIELDPSSDSPAEDPLDEKPAQVWQRNKEIGILQRRLVCRSTTGRHQPCF